MNERKKLEGLQILRAIAFFDVFLGHCGVSFFTAAFGVSIFIVLSGFCVAVNYLPKIDSIKLRFGSGIKFSLLKIKKIYGLHLVMTAFAFWLSGMPTSATELKRMLMNVLLLQSWSIHSADYFSFNGVAWYLSCYMFICIAALWMLKAISKLKKKNTAILLCVMLYMLMLGVGYYVEKNPQQIGSDVGFWLTYISPVYRGVEFLLGAAAGWFYLHRSEEENVTVGAVSLQETAAVLMYIGATMCFPAVERIHPGLCYTAFFTPISLLLVLVFVKNNGIVKKILARLRLVEIGNLSAYLFLIHQMVHYWLRGILSKRYEGAVLLFLICILTFAISIGAAKGILMFQEKKIKRGIQ